MAIEINVPRLGWSSEDGIFAGWLKQPGERVVSGEPLFALESDKVTMEVEALDSGILRPLEGGPAAGALVVVGQVIGYLAAEGEQVAEIASAAAGAEPAAGETAAARPTPASPRARARAKSLGIELAAVSPAPGGRRIVEEDVLRAAAALPKPAAVPVEAPSVAARGRRVIAARLEESFRTPHFYVQADVNATALARLREELLPVLLERDGVRLSVNDLLIKATALALRARPEVNRYWRDGESVPWETAHIGLAVQTEENLLVPVIRDADRLGVGALARARQALVEKSQAGRLQAGDSEGASLTISNLGAFGVDRFQAILNPPQSLILAVGRMAKRPVVEGDAVVARLTLPLSVSVDHRVIDGVAAARFLEALVQTLEAPLRLLL
ncbi:MAG: 2-oxo acid dehydrogenase subunit E2 [Acidobacteriaceae bacterium]|nr:2-oxo acid dehydrogenase subunit E2 [Acidobacteriaceae bacterium]